MGKYCDFCTSLANSFENKRKNLFYCFLRALSTSSSQHWSAKWTKLFLLHSCLCYNYFNVFFLNFVSSISWSSHLLNHYKPNCLHFNSLTTSHQFNCLQNSLIWIYGVLLSFGHLMMIPCGSKHVGIFNVMS